jgi:hypothetical protein
LIDQILVYWDNQVPNNESWAYRLLSGDKLLDSGSLDSESDDLLGAIDESIAISGLGINRNSFAIDKFTDGGYAIWTS